MLKQLDKHQRRLLELAEFIDGLDPDRFSMSSWGCDQEPRCICGWYQQIHGHFAKDDWQNAAEGLGLDTDTATKLFASNRMTKSEAVKALSPSGTRSLMRFNFQCKECGGYKWCGRDCYQIRLINAKVPPYQEDEIAIVQSQAKFDRKAHMREWWRKKREHI